jgi:large subunit ribosomal protein L13
MKKAIDRKYHLFDSKSEALGRLATQIVTVLRGKNKVDFTPNIDGGDIVVVVNSDNLKVTGNKKTGKIYHYFSGYPGGIRDVRLEELLEKDSRKVIAEAVYGMLPKNKLRARMMTRLKIYKDDKHEHKIDITH